MNLSKPFEGLKVIELASVLAGPAVGMFFAELGARVIKIENPTTGGDVTRKWKLPEENPDDKTSAYYHSCNWGKEIQFLSISEIEGRDELLKLLSDADILLSNFKKGDAEKFNLDFEFISKKFPKLIYAKITGYGENSSRTAFDLVLQAESGFMSMNGTPESGPLKMPIAFIDLMAAHQLKEGILIALLNRFKSGNGCCVHVSLQDAAIASLANQASNFLIANHSAKPSGSLHPNIAPYGETFLCKDKKYIVLAVGNDKQFFDLCIAFKVDHLFTNEKFKNNQQRILNRTELFQEFEKSFLVRNSNEIEELLNKFQVPFGVVKNIGEALRDSSFKNLILDNKCVKTAIFNLTNAQK